MKIVRHYSVFFYFLLTFVISWGGLLLVIGGPSQITTATPGFYDLLPLVILAILAGPSISGTIFIFQVDRRKSLQKFKASLTKKVNPKWYISVFLGAPLAVSAAYLILSLFSSEFVPGIFSVDNKFSHLLTGFMTGVAAGFFEEIGWTGLAIPKLLKKNSVLKTGLIVGIIWAFWHILPGLWLGYGDETIKNTVSLVSYVADPFFFLVIYRILMVWVYKQTESLPVAMIMHGSLTASARIFTPIGIVGIPLLVFGIVWVLSTAIIARGVFTKNPKFQLPA